MHLASLDGEVAPAEQTCIPVTDEGLLRGDGVFEVIRVYAGRPFALDEHLARLRRSAQGIRLEADHERLREEVRALLARAGAVDALLRLVLTRGGRRIAIVEPLPPQPPMVDVKTVTFAPSRILDGLKTTSYAANMLAGRLAKEEGYDEALLVTPHGRVLEGPTWTLFYVVAGQLRTPPLEDRILHSITRRLVLEASGGTERVTTLDDLRPSEEAFIASTVREVLPIRRIDDIELPEAPGPVAQRARRALRDRIEAELSS
jgi:branched-chain amino acid aminotransferase